jgi:hypothetical protein
MINPTDEFVSHYTDLGLTGSPASTEEVELLEKQLGVSFPAAYKAFLFILGRDGGPDFVGSDCTVRWLPELRQAADRLLQQCGSPFKLPENAVVFLMHQGYFFVYFVADGINQDPPVYGYREGAPQPSLIAASFSEWLQL